MDIYWLWLAALKGVGAVTQRNLVKEFGSPRAVHSATQEELRATKGLRAQVIETIIDSRSMEHAKQTEELMLLSLLCSMELEGHVMISGQTVRATNNHTEFSQ